MPHLVVVDPNRPYPTKRNALCAEFTRDDIVKSEVVGLFEDRIFVFETSAGVKRELATHRNDGASLLLRDLARPTERAGAIDVAHVNKREGTAVMLRVGLGDLLSDPDSLQAVFDYIGRRHGLAEIFRIDITLSPRMLSEIRALGVPAESAVRDAETLSQALDGTQATVDRDIFERVPGLIELARCVAKIASESGYHAYINGGTISEGHGENNRELSGFTLTRNGEGFLPRYAIPL